MPAPIHISGLILNSGPATLEVNLNKRAKRLILKVDPVNSKAVITVPSKSWVPQALAFANARKSWIDDQMRTGARAHPFVHGAICPLRGEPHEIVNEGLARENVHLRSAVGQPLSGKIIVGGDARHCNRRTVDWLKKEAKRDLSTWSDFYAQKVGKNRGRITIRDTKSRWGSCSSDGAMSFSWRLILAPPWVLQYVAAHECAHLVFLDHSAEYWRLLKSLQVDVDGAREWFASYGQRLHAYGVEAPKTPLNRSAA